MEERCQSCGAPTVAGFAYCGNCGARVTGPTATTAPGATTDRPFGLPVPAEAQPVADVPATDVPATDVPVAAPSAVTASRWQGRPRPASVGVAGIIVLVLALLRLGSPTSAPHGPLAPAPEEGGGQFVDVEVPDLTGTIRWSLDRSETVGQDRFAWAAPVLTDREVVVVVPGGVLFHGRDAGAATQTRVEVPTSAHTGAAVLDAGRARVAVVADSAAWVLEPGRVLARSGDDDTADVTPVAIGTDTVLVEGKLGSVHRLEVEGSRMVETGSLRGVDVDPAGGAVPRFHLAVHALDDTGIWLGGQARGTGEWSLFRLDLPAFEVTSELRLGTTDTPTTLAVPEVPGGVVIAFDDRVMRLAGDGATIWEAVPGSGAEVLGAADGRVLVRHERGRVVYGLEDGREIGRASTGLINGPRSTSSGGEVLVLDESQVLSLRIRDATVGRRLDGRPLSIGGQDERLIAWVVAGERDAPVLRLLPTPDRAPVPPGELEARDIALSLPSAAPGRPACNVVGLGNRVVWHDGAQLREVLLDTGRERAALAAGSSSGSTVVARADDVLLVDVRGVIRQYGSRLAAGDILPIGDDPIGGLATAGGLTVVGGGTGRLATLSSTSGYLRGVTSTGASAWLVRTRESLVSPPVARAGTAAVRQRNGSVALVQDGLLVADLEGDGRSLDPPVLDGRGVLRRDGEDVVASFPQGDEAWRTAEVSFAPGLASDGELVVARSGSAVIGLDRATGAPRWRTALIGSDGVEADALGAPVVAGGRVVVLVHDAVIVLDRATGEVVSRADDLPTLRGGFAPTSLGIVACTAQGRLVLIG